eukprot:EG_transcript_6760
MAPLPPHTAAGLLCAALFWGEAEAQYGCGLNGCSINGQCVPYDQCQSVSMWSRALIWFSIAAGIFVGVVAAGVLLWLWKRPKGMATQQMQLGHSQEPIAGVALAVVPSNTPNMPMPGPSTPYTPLPSDRKEDLENPQPHPEDDASVALDDGMYGPLVDDPAPPPALAPRPAEPVTRAPSWWRG